MRPTIDWSFAKFDLEEIVHCIDPENVASQAVARRLGAVSQGGTMLLSHPVDLWVTRRSS
jgi:RimJ/RimL family protein N-acetyltransferase